MEHEWSFGTGEDIPELPSGALPIVLLLSMAVVMLGRRQRKM